MFSAALFMITKHQKDTMSFNKRIGKPSIVSPYGEILFGKKVNELLINLAIWIKLKDIMLSERN